MLFRSITVKDELTAMGVFDELVAPDRLEDAHGRQLVLDGDAVDGLALAEQRAHRLEDLAVSVAVELLRADDLDHLGERLAVEEDAAEEALFRVQVVGRHAAVGQGDDTGGNAHGSILRMGSDNPSPKKPVKRNLVILWIPVEHL